MKYVGVIPTCAGKARWVVSDRQSGSDICHLCDGKGGAVLSYPLTVIGSEEREYFAAQQRLYF